jgi:hypothetical protein
MLIEEREPTHRVTSWKERPMLTLSRVWLIVGVVVIVFPLIAHAQAFDGNYAGSLTLKTNNAPGRSSCALVDNSRTLTIKGGQLSILYNPKGNVTLTGMVGADGNFAASGSSPLGGVKMTGRIQGNSLTAEVVSTYCVHTLQMTK